MGDAMPSSPRDTNLNFYFKLSLSPLVANEHDNHVGVGVLAGVFQPGRQVVEGLSPGDVVH